MLSSVLDFAVARNARKAAATAKLPARELAAVERAARTFFDASANYEADRTGTGASGYVIERRGQLEDQYVDALEGLADLSFAVPAVELAEAEENLARRMKCLVPAGRHRRGSGLFAYVSDDDLRRTHRLWMSYRDAFGTLVHGVRPDADEKAWKAWLTDGRVDMLRGVQGCW
jgi:hypothetical protein